MKILIVDDDEIALEVLQHFLEPAGHTVRIAHDGIEAWEMLRHESFRMVISDWVMPGMNGVDLCRKIREGSLPHYVYVILLTCWTRELDIVEGLAAGADDILSKPFRPAELRVRIHNAERILNLEELAASSRLLADTRSVLEKQNLQLQDLYKTAQTFVDNVSHEFRTPLMVIKEYASLISENAFGDVSPSQREYLEVIANRADDLNTMVDDMLDGSRLDTGMVSVVRHKCRIEEIIARVRPLLERKAIAQGVTLQIQTFAPPVDLYVDEEKISRVLINLTVNAIKFCGDPGEVCVWTQLHASGGVTIGITDNGPGIPAERQTEIFERFTQLETNVRGSSKGFGLGLSIAKELVDLNLGEMELQSELGHGTTFSFTLPSAEPINVLDSYLDRMITLNGPDAMVSLISATIPNDGGCDVSELQEFLAHLLRRNDLLFQTGANHWLLLTPLSGIEEDKMLEYLQRALRDSNRNRPRGLLPEVVFKRIDTWTIADRRVQIGEQFALQFKSKKQSLVVA